MNFNDMSIKDLRTYAKENGIKLHSATKKSDIVAILEEATPDTTEEDLTPLEDTSDGTIMSAAEEARAEEEEQTIETLRDVETPDQKPESGDAAVCVYSERKYHSSKLGSLDLGYNIVKESLATLWVRLPDVRLASKEELVRAKQAGVKPGELVGPRGRRM